MTVLDLLPPAPLNYEQRMPRCEEAPELHVVGPDVFGRETHLTHATAQAWEAMRLAAEKAGVRLLFISGFRSVERQAEIVQSKLQSGLALPEVLKVNAYPGYSEHHTGRAVDIGSPDCAHLTEAFARTREFAWLQRHAASFGFALSYPRENACGIAFEPWHWCMKPPILFVREATANDAPAIEALYRELVIDPHVCVLPAQVASIAASTTGFLLVAEAYGVVCATALLTLCPDAMYRTQPFGVIENIVVTPTMRGRGIGGLLLAHVERLAFSHHCTKVMLLSGAARHDAHAFFRRQGFDDNTKRAFVKYRRQFSIS